MSDEANARKCRELEEAPVRRDSEGVDSSDMKKADRRRQMHWKTS